MDQVTIVKPLLPLWKRWSVQAQGVFAVLNGAVLAGWEYLRGYPDTLEWMGLSADAQIVTSLTHIIRIVTAVNISVSTGTILLAAARQKPPTE